MLWCRRRAVRLHCPIRHEKRPVLVLLQQRDCPVRRMIIPVGFAIPVQDHAPVRIRRAAQVLRQRRRHIRRQRTARFPRQRQIMAAGRAVARFALARRTLRHIPRLWIINPPVKNLPAPHRHIPVVPEQLWQADPVRMRRAKGRLISQHTRLGRRPPRQQRRPRGIAQRKLAVIMVEPHPRLCQSIQIRRHRPEPACITTQFHPHIVRHKKKHIRPALARRCGRGGIGERRMRQRCGRRRAGHLSQKCPSGDGIHMGV